MIDLYYMTEAPFINDREWIARRVRSTPQIVIELLHEFFELREDDLWHSSRADKEIAKYQYLQESGKKGAEKRWGIRDGKPTNSIPNSPPIATPIATKTITKNQDHINTPDGVTQSVWDDYLKIRKAAKKPITNTALKGLVREAGKAGKTLNEALVICCERSWLGFKAEWLNSDVKQVEKVKFI